MKALHGTTDSEKWKRERKKIKQKEKEREENEQERCKQTLAMIVDNVTPNDARFMR